MNTIFVMVLLVLVGGTEQRIAIWQYAASGKPVEFRTQEACIAEVPEAVAAARPGDKVQKVACLDRKMVPPEFLGTKARGDEV